MPVTFINALRVPANRADEFLDKWQAGADYVLSRPGCLASTLHRNVDPTGPHQFFTVAVWETPEHFVDATSTE